LSTPQGLELYPDPALRVDGDRLVTDVNEALAVLVGHGRAALVGRPVASALGLRTPGGEPVLADGWPRAAALRSVRVAPEHELLITTVRGEERALVTGRYERDKAGAVVGAVLALRQPRRTTGEPRGAEVVSTVSHELRSPLTSVKGYTSLLLNRWDRLPDDQKRMMLEQVHADADRVTRLITELLDISRLEIGRLVLRRQPVDMADLAARVVEKLSLAYPGLECAIEFAPGFPKVYADPDKLEQVLTNLVENAAKYASPTGMRMVGEARADAVVVAVHDRGDGIPAPDLARVFRKFFRGDQTRPTGTGLGLWISRGLVEAHGGRLTATSLVGEGSVFRFSLPLVDLDAVLGA